MNREKKPRRAGNAIADPLSGFLPPVRAWFRRTFARPSPAQVQAWPVIRRGDSTLLLAPTGSGKTLAAFLCAIDGLIRRDRAGELTDAIHVLYISSACLVASLSDASSA